MADQQLNGVRVAILATDGFEESELVEPVKAVEAAGAKYEVISMKPGKIQGFKHHEKAGTVPVHRTLDDVRPDEFDALVLPGGALNADTLRVEKKAQEFVRAFDRAQKPIAVICHGPWLLASAGLVRGRKITSYHTIQDDLRNAGANWQDSEVVRDGNWVSSRQPKDLPAFNREMVALFAEKARARKAA